MDVNNCSIALVACLFYTNTVTLFSQESPFAFSVQQEIALLTTGLAGQVIGQHRLSNMAPTRPEELRRGDLSPLDRWNAGTWNPRFELAGDIAAWSVGGAMIYADVWHAFRSDEGGPAARRPLLEDVLILSQAFAWNSAINLNVRATRVHPRPFVYGTAAPESERHKGEAAGGFYSGHASAAFLGAVYVSTVYPLRHPDFEHTGWLWAGSLATATASSAFRIAAGKHFPTDVIAGAAMGSLIGLGFVQLHLKDNAMWGLRPMPLLTPDGQVGVMAVGRL
jgi:membrane-associated phospholipid phosphatase